MELLIGIAVVIAALFIITILTVWSRSRINKLAESGFPSARDFERDNSHEQ